MNINIVRTNIILQQFRLHDTAGDEVHRQLLLLMTSTRKG